MHKSSNLRKIRKSMEKTLDPKRFEHTLGVAYTAAALAMCYGEDIVKAETAGMLHDCAKCMSNEKKLSICEKHNISINDIEYKNPFLLHAKVGSYIAMKKYNVHDRDTINAILNHTTGRPNMSLLEKIIFVADYIEPGRKQAPNLSEIRRQAFLDLDEALFRILGDTLVYLDSVKGDVDPMTQKTYDFYKEYMENKRREAAHGQHG
ncbi:MAG: bis(5'-nucleosyl)-tetraphosphatase (symmetrical) YqeK [Lachnospiraceae bacterium]|nr:bis(5'-nucleosyl)-tetraphosphatase (symmetrical) YqeK [Lachnospiraceae bacterium]